MNKNIFVLVLSLIMILVSMTSCIYDMNMTSPAAVSDNDYVNNGGQNSNKIASLQIEINNASDGATINLSNYASIDIEESITINKNVTITNGNLRGSNLKILSDGVSLNNIHNTSIATNSSMKISGSSLNSLSIQNISSPSLSVTSLGRGGDATSDAKVPKVILDGTSVNGDLTVSIPKTFISIGTSSSSVSSVEAIKITAQDAQLTVTDKRSDIKAITFEKPCQIVLEDGTSDKIAAPTAADNADADAAATQIDMTSASPTLERLSVSSGMPVFVKYGTLPDFSSLIVLGEYSVTAGVTIYKGDFCYDGDNNKIYKSESDFTVKIGDQIYYENGSVKSTAPLSSGQKDVIISKGSVTYSFKINVGEEEAPAEKKPILTGIEIKNGADINQNVYHVGDVFSLKGLVVEGTYSYGDDNTYTSVLTGWTSVPADGTVIKAEHNQASLTVSYGSVSAEINNFITLSNDCSFTFVPYPETPAKDIVVKYVANGQTVSALTGLSRPDYKFEGWWTSADGGAEFDFTSSISTDTVVYAKWKSIKHSIKYMDQTGDNSWIDITETLSGAKTSFTELEDVTIAADPSTKLGYSFAGWSDNSADLADATIDYKWFAGEQTSDVTLYAKWDLITYTIHFNKKAADGEDNLVDLTKDDMTFDITKSSITLPIDNHYWNSILTGDVSTDKWGFRGWTAKADITPGSPYSKSDIINKYFYPAQNTSLIPTVGNELQFYAVWDKAEIVYASGSDGNWTYTCSKDVESGKTPIGVVIDTLDDNQKVILSLMDSTNDMIWCDASADGYNKTTSELGLSSGASYEVMFAHVNDATNDALYPAYAYCKKISKQASSCGVKWGLPDKDSLLCVGDYTAYFNISLQSVLTQNISDLTVDLIQEVKDQYFYWSCTTAIYITEAPGQTDIYRHNGFGENGNIHKNGMNLANPPVYKPTYVRAAAIVTITQ